MSAVEHYLSMAIGHLDARRFREAAGCAGQGLEHFPDDGRLWQLYGSAQWSLGEFSAAQEALERSSVFIPLNEPAQCALADCYVRSGQPDAARAIYAFLAEKELHDCSLLPAVAVGLGRLGDYELALRVCQRIVWANPTHHQAFFGIAFYLNRLGAPVGALIDPLAMALDLAPHILTYRLNLAFVFADLDRFDEAYSIIQSVAPESVRCPCWLRKMLTIFEQFGDDERCSACRKQLEAIVATGRNP